MATAGSMTDSYGTLAYGVALGVLAMTAVSFIAIGVRRPYGPSRPFMLAFAAMTAISALAAWNLVELHTSSTVEEYTDNFEVFGLLGLFAAVSIVLVVAAWTGAIPRWALIGFGVSSVVVGIFQFALPNGLLADEITALRSVELFGETFVVHEATTSPWRPLLDVYLVASVMMILVALAIHFRRGRRAESVVMSAGLVVLLAVGAYDSLVDEGVVDTPYLAPFGGVVIAIAGAVLVSGRISRAEAQIARHSVELEQMVVERTAALIAANDDLNEQLARQRVTVRRLETLTEQFERSNQVVGPGVDAAETRMLIASVLETLGSMLGLRRAALRLDVVDETDALPSISEWIDERIGASVESVTIAEPVIMEGEVLGSLEVASMEAVRLGDEELRYVRLAAKHLAGFVHRAELESVIAANAVDVERHRIARDLHDSVTQRLYSVAFLAEAAERQLETEPVAARDTVQRIRTLLLTSLSELRVLLFELQPQSLDSTRFPQLIEQLVDTVGAGVDADVEADVDEIPVLPRDVKLGMYRLAQESLSNAVRHSGADSISVRVCHHQGVTTMAVRDSGVGFDLARVERGHGLRNLEDRAASIGARVHIESTTDVGTEVTVDWEPVAVTS